MQRPLARGHYKVLLSVYCLPPHIQTLYSIFMSVLGGLSYRNGPRLSFPVEVTHFLFPEPQPYFLKKNVQWFQNYTRTSKAHHSPIGFKLLSEDRQHRRGTNKCFSTFISQERRVGMELENRANGHYLLIYFCKFGVQKAAHFPLESLMIGSQLLEGWIEQRPLRGRTRERHDWAPQPRSNLFPGNLSRNCLRSPGSRAESRKSKSLWHSSPEPSSAGVFCRNWASENATLSHTEELKVFVAPQLCIPCLLCKLERYSSMSIYLFINTYHKYLFSFHDVEKWEKCGSTSDQIYDALGKADNYTNISKSYGKC